MYLSRVKLDVSRRDTQMALVAPSRFHGNIESAFHGDRKRRLWRIDHLGGVYYILLLSEEKPDLLPLQSQFGFADQPGETRSYDPFLERLEEGTCWRFRLTANPTRSISKQGERGKVQSQVSERYMKEWLAHKAEKNGFSLVEQEPMIRQVQWVSFRKKRTAHLVRFKAASFEGALQITDLSLFVEALTNGIGREKAYGMGLLTIARL